MIFKSSSEVELIVKKNRTKEKNCILQVWFQNKRSKERRLKQLTSMGRSPFFGGSRKIRGFPLNLNHSSMSGDDVPPPGFSYFADKFDFNYGAPITFHHEFFGSHPPSHSLGTFSGPNNPGNFSYLLFYY